MKEMGQTLWRTAHEGVVSKNGLKIFEKGSSGSIGGQIVALARVGAKTFQVLKTWKVWRTHTPRQKPYKG